MKGWQVFYFSINTRWCCLLFFLSCFELCEKKTVEHMTRWFTKMLYTNETVIVIIKYIYLLYRCLTLWSINYHHRRDILCVELLPLTTFNTQFLRHPCLYRMVWMQWLKGESLPTNDIYSVFDKLYSILFSPFPRSAQFCNTCRKVLLNCQNHTTYSPKYHHYQCNHHLLLWEKLIPFLYSHSRSPSTTVWQRLYNNTNVQHHI